MDCLLGGPSRARCLARDGLAVSASARSGRLGPRRAGSFQALPGLRGSAPDNPARPIPAAASEPGTEAPLPATGTRRIMRGAGDGGDEEPEDSFPRPVRIRHPGRSEAESRDLNAVAPPALRPRIFAAARLVRGDEKSCRLPLRRVDEVVADDPAYRCYRFRLDPAGRMAAPMQPGAARGAAGRRDDHAGQGAGI